MSEVEGIKAKVARENREKLNKLFSQDPDTHQLIVICTDLTGQTPTHVHISGPSKDKVLLYGMLGVARDCVQMGSK